MSSYQKDQSKETPQRISGDLATTGDLDRTPLGAQLPPTERAPYLRNSSGSGHLEPTTSGSPKKIDFDTSGVATAGERNVTVRSKRSGTGYETQPETLQELVTVSIDSVDNLENAAAASNSKGLTDHPPYDSSTRTTEKTEHSEKTTKYSKEPHCTITKQTIGDNTDSNDSRAGVLQLQEIIATCQQQLKATQDLQHSLQNRVSELESTNGKLENKLKQYSAPQNNTQVSPKSQKERKIYHEKSSLQRNKQEETAYSQREEADSEDSTSDESRDCSSDDSPDQGTPTLTTRDARKAISIRGQQGQVITSAAKEITSKTELKKLGKTLQKHHTGTPKMAADWIITQTPEDETPPLTNLKTKAQRGGMVVRTAIDDYLEQTEQYKRTLRQAVSVMVEALTSQTTTRPPKPHELTVEQTVEALCRMGKGKESAFLTMTESGMIDEEWSQTAPVDDEPGTKWLERSDHAWLVLSQGIANVLSYQQNPESEWTSAVRQALPKGATVTIRKQVIEGTLSRSEQQSVVKTIATMKNKYKYMETVLAAHNLQREYFSAEQKVVYLMMVAPTNLVTRVRDSLRRDRTLTPQQRMSPTWSEVTKKLKEEQEADQLPDWGIDDGDAKQHQQRSTNRNHNKTKTEQRATKRNNRNHRETDKPDERPRRPDNRPESIRDLTKEELQAMANYCAYHKKPITKTNIEEVKTSPEKVEGWLKKPQECRWHQQGTCRRGDGCLLLHSKKEKPQNHNTEVQESDDSDSSDSSECDDECPANYHIEADETDSDSSEAESDTSGDKSDPDYDPDAARQQKTMHQMQQMTLSTMSQIAQETSQSTGSGNRSHIQQENILTPGRKRTKQMTIQRQTDAENERVSLTDDLSTGSQYYWAVEDPDLADATIHTPQKKRFSSYAMAAAQTTNTPERTQRQKTTTVHIAILSSDGHMLTHADAQGKQHMPHTTAQSSTTSQITEATTRLLSSILDTTTIGFTQPYTIARATEANSEHIIRTIKLDRESTQVDLQPTWSECEANVPEIRHPPQWHPAENIQHLHNTHKSDMLGIMLNTQWMAENTMNINREHAWVEFTPTQTAIIENAQTTMDDAIAWAAQTKQKRAMTHWHDQHKSHNQQTINRKRSRTGFASPRAANMESTQITIDDAVAWAARTKQKQAMMYWYDQYNAYHQQMPHPSQHTLGQEHRIQQQTNCTAPNDASTPAPPEASQRQQNIQAVETCRCGAQHGHDDAYKCTNTLTTAEELEQKMCTPCHYSMTKTGDCTLCGCTNCHNAKKKNEHTARAEYTRELNNITKTVGETFRPGQERQAQASLDRRQEALLKSYNNKDIRGCTCDCGANQNPCPYKASPYTRKTDELESECQMCQQKHMVHKQGEYIGDWCNCPCQHCQRARSENKCGHCGQGTITEAQTTMSDPWDKCRSCIQADATELRRTIQHRAQAEAFRTLQRSTRQAQNKCNHEIQSDVANASEDTEPSASNSSTSAAPQRMHMHNQCVGTMKGVRCQRPASVGDRCQKCLRSMYSSACRPENNTTDGGDDTDEDNHQGKPGHLPPSPKKEEHAKTGESHTEQLMEITKKSNSANLRKRQGKNLNPSSVLRYQSEQRRQKKETIKNLKAHAKLATSTKRVHESTHQTPRAAESNPPENPVESVQCHPVTADDQLHATQAKKHRKTTGFAARIQGLTRAITAGFDTYAEISVLRESLANEEWRLTAEKQKEKLKGVGQKWTGPMYAVPVTIREGTKPVTIYARTLPDSSLPTNCDMLIGLPAQEDLELEINIPKTTATVKLYEPQTNKGQYSMIYLEHLAEIADRIQSDPLNVVDLCAGVSPAAIIMRDLGWNINTWLAIEPNKWCKQVASAHTPQIQHIDYVHQLTNDQIEAMTNIDMILASPPCKHFSVAPDEPKGFDSIDGQTFEQTATAVNKLKESSPRAKVLFETTPLHQSLKHIAEEQNDLMPEGITFKNITAIRAGGAQIRDRKIATDITDISYIQQHNWLPLQKVLHPSALPINGKTTLPAVMTKPNTHHPVLVKSKTPHAESSKQRLATIKELESTQGYMRGITSGWGTLETGYKQQHKMLGNMWNYQQMRAILSKYRKAHTTEAHPFQCHTDSKQEETQWSPEELKWLGLTDQQMLSKMKEMLKDYTQHKHYITVKDTDKTPWQVPHSERARTPSALLPAARAELRLRLERGHIKLVKYSPKAWMSRMFTKLKGRTNPQTGLEAIRFLTDLRTVNSAISWNKYWLDESPTIEKVRTQIPRNARYFASEDISDAYESSEIDERSKHLLHAVPPFPIRPEEFTDEELKRWSREPIEELRKQKTLYLQWDGCPQGLASAAPWFNVHLADGLNHLFGEAWREFAAIFVDDLLIHGATYEQCELRQRMFMQALKALGKGLSNKCDRSIKTTGHIVGLTFTKDGITPDEAVIDVLKEELRKTPTTTKQAQHLIGVTLYSSTAFKWTPEDMTWFARTMAPMHAAVSKDSFKGAWTEECKRSAQILLSRISTMPRAHASPADLITPKPVAN